MDVHLLRRKGWTRIILYMLCFVLILHVFNTFTRPEPPSRMTRSLPWYKNSHPSLTMQDHPHIKLQLTSKERDRLQVDKVNLAKEQAARAFPESGIIGSVFKTKSEADEFRRRVDCWTQGDWVQVSDPAYIMPHFQDPIYGSCERKYKRTHPEGVRPAVKYVWRSPCDPMVDIDAAKWCKVLGGRNLLIVGDLVQYQLHEVFLDTLRDGPAVCFGELNCKDHTVCSEPDTMLRYLRNDVLSTRRKMDDNNGNPKADVIEWPFVSSTLLKAYSIMILNRAPVIESDDQFIQGLITTLKTIRKQNPDIMILYRSTGIGHPFCDDATEPLKERLTDEQMKELPYGWSEENRRNAIARVIVEQAGGLFIDLGALTDLRPDGHIGGSDCLRYCIPGPLTGWAQVLYQVFLGLEGAL